MYDSDAPRLPKVTVVIPAYNMERYVERTLLSAINQTYANLQILVIDDGSTDRTLEIVEAIARAHDNVRVISVANAGVAAARNLGIELADSPYVAFLDADDLWAPSKVEKQVGALARHGHCEEWAASYALYRMIDDFDAVIDNGLPTNARGDFFAEHLSWNHVGNGSSLLVRRDAALAVGGFNSDYARNGIGGCEDLEFQLKLLQRYKIELVREYEVGYRIHAAQMSCDLVRMRLSRVAVVENIAAGEKSAKWRKRMLVEAYLAAAQAYRRARAWGHAARWLFAAVTLSPLETAIRIKRLSWREMRYRAHNMIKPSARPNGPQEPQRTFYAFDPIDGVDADIAITARYLGPLLAAARARSSRQLPVAAGQTDRTAGD